MRDEIRCQFHTQLGVLIVEHAQTAEYSFAVVFYGGPEFVLFFVHGQHLPVDKLLVAHLGHVVGVYRVPMPSIPRLCNSDVNKNNGRGYRDI